MSTNTRQESTCSGESVAHPILSWLCTIPYTVVFILILVVCHPFHLLASLFGTNAHKWALDIMNWMIITNIRVLTGARYRVTGVPYLPSDKSIILVSNHQSMYDIPMIMWVCRSRHVGFIAKRELGRWIPSISLALRRLGSVLIDRSDAAQAVRDIQAFGKMKHDSKQVAAIFPEGTRARDGKVKRFKATGLQALVRSMPDAVLQPIAIHGNWELLRYNFWPVPFGTHIEVEFLDPIDPSTYSDRELTGEVEGRIRAALEK
jgi:1-acyl-sn-glycerol-3-phosphate acyltransferase